MPTRPPLSPLVPVLTLPPANEAMIDAVLSSVPTRPPALVVPLTAPVAKEFVIAPSLWPTRPPATVPLTVAAEDELAIVPDAALRPTMPPVTLFEPPVIVELTTVTLLTLPLFSPARTPTIALLPARLAWARSRLRAAPVDPMIGNRPTGRLE